jgi:hypothetical protein
MSFSCDPRLPALNQRHEHILSPSTASSRILSSAAVFCWNPAPGDQPHISSDFFAPADPILRRRPRCLIFLRSAASGFISPRGHLQSPTVEPQHASASSVPVPVLVHDLPACPPWELAVASLSSRPWWPRVSLAPAPAMARPSPASSLRRALSPARSVPPMACSSLLPCSSAGSRCSHGARWPSFSAGAPLSPLPVPNPVAPPLSPSAVAPCRISALLALRVPLQFAQPGRIPCRLHPWLLRAAAILPGARPRPRRRSVAPAPLLLPHRSPRSLSPCSFPCVCCDARFQLTSQILCVAPNSDFAGRRSLTHVPVGVV